MFLIRDSISLSITQIEAELAKYHDGLPPITHVPGERVLGGEGNEVSGVRAVAPGMSSLDVRLSSKPFAVINEILGGSPAEQV